MVDLLEMPTAQLARRSRRRRYNVSLDPEDVRRMDSLAMRLGVSRSELLTFAFNRLASELSAVGGDE